MTLGRILAIDYGSVRLGLAISDAGRTIASPLATVNAKSEAITGGTLKRIVAEHEVSLILIGLPVHLSGHEGAKAAEARRFGQWVQSTTGVLVHFWDERFTTVEAERQLWVGGLTNKKRKARRDRVAAQIMLQSYLDAGCPQESGAGPLQ